MSAARDHRNMVEQLLTLRAIGSVPEDLEEQLLSQLDDLWAQLTEDEREAERARAAARLAVLRAVEKSGLRLVDVPIRRGLHELPRKAA